MKSVEVRFQLVDTLRLDLVGPGLTFGTPDESLSQSPSRWYLTGFLVPLDAGEEQRAQEGSDDPIDEMNEAGGSDDANPPEPAAARRAYMPSSIGMSILVHARHSPIEGDGALGRLSPSTAEGGARRSCSSGSVPPREEQIVLDSASNTLSSPWKRKFLPAKDCDWPFPCGRSIAMATKAACRPARDQFPSSWSTGGGRPLTIPATRRSLFRRRSRWPASNRLSPGRISAAWAAATGTSA